MPALRGSLTYARFFVEGALPDDFHDRWLKAIRLRAMRPLGPDDEEKARSGWCRVGEPFELELDAESVFWDEHLNLGFRTDRWAIPGALLRARLREAEAAHLARTGRERMGRAEKGELKEMVLRKLRKELVPAVRCVDMSWSLHDGIVRFFSHATKPGAEMQELFKKTFGLSLVAEAPWTLAVRTGISRTQDAAWVGAEPIDLERGAS